jgi:hypothetical protein
VLQKLKFIPTPFVASANDYVSLKELVAFIRAVAASP